MFDHVLGKFVATSAQVWIWDSVCMLVCLWEGICIWEAASIDTVWLCAVCSVQTTVSLSHVHCMSHIAMLQCIVWLCAVCSVQWSLCTVHTVCTVHCALSSVQCALCSEQTTSSLSHWRNSPYWPAVPCLWKQDHESNLSQALLHCTALLHSTPDHSVLQCCFCCTLSHPGTHAFIYIACLYRTHKNASQRVNMHKTEFQNVHPVYM